MEIHITLFSWKLNVYSWLRRKKDKNLKDLILVGGLLVNLIDCINFLSPSQGCHVNSVFPCTVRLWNYLPKECYPLTYNLDGFKFRTFEVCGHCPQVLSKQLWSFYTSFSWNSMPYAFLKKARSNTALSIWVRNWLCRWK